MPTVHAMLSHVEALACLQLLECSSKKSMLVRRRLHVNLQQVVLIEIQCTCLVLEVMDVMPSTMAYSPV